MSWQPIATALKDGSTFIAARIDGGKIELDSVEAGRYDPRYWPNYTPVGNGLYTERLELLYEWTLDNMPRMTHWMPLPAPPEIEQ